MTGIYYSVLIGEVVMSAMGNPKESGSYGSRLLGREALVLTVLNLQCLI
jgi:hypothetical protein